MAEKLDRDEFGARLGCLTLVVVVLFVAFQVLRRLV